MGFLSSLLRKPVYLKDEVFGPLKLEHKGVGKDEECWFLNEAFVFTPTGSIISCSVTTDNSGPTDAQRTYLLYIANNYRRLLSAIMPTVEASLKAWKPDLRISNFENEFQLVGLSIPYSMTSPVEWDWSFETEHDENHMLTIYMRDDEPNPDVQYDG